MRNISQRVSEGRPDDDKAVSFNELLNFGLVGYFKYMAEMSRIADEMITECMEDCDDDGRVEICPDDGMNPCLMGCKLINKDCAYGVKVIERAKISVLNYLNKIVPKKIFKDLSKVKQTQALNLASGWKYKGVLYLFGESGIGKSFCAAWLLYNHKLNQVTKYWDREDVWNDILTGISWVSAYDAVDKLNFEMVKRAPMLILDDLGTEQQTPGNKSTIGEIIAKRYDNDVPTIITSNINPNSLMYGKRVTDRIADEGYCVEFTGVSMRTSA